MEVFWSRKVRRKQAQERRWAREDVLDEKCEDETFVESLVSKLKPRKAKKKEKRITQHKKFSSVKNAKREEIRNQFRRLAHTKTLSRKAHKRIKIRVIIVRGSV